MNSPNQFQVNEDTEEALDWFFSPPSFEIYNTHVMAIDFIERDDVDDVREILQDITNQSEIPKIVDVTIDDIQFYAEEWLVWEPSTDIFDWVKIQVFHYQEDVHQAAFLMLFAKTSDEELKNTVSHKTRVSSKALQLELEEIWHDLFPRNLPGVVSKLERINTRNLVEEARLRSPITLSSAQVLSEDFEEVRGSPGPDDRLSDHEPFQKSVRDSDFCDRFGINHTSPLSITQSFDDSFILISTFGQGMVEYQWKHDRYAFIQIIDRYSDKLVHHTGWNQFGSTYPVYPNNPPGKVMIRALPHLYYLFYFFRIPFEIEAHEDCLRRQQIGFEEGTDFENKISEFHEFESSFYTDYVQFLDNDDAARSLIKSHKKMFSEESTYFECIPKARESPDEMPGVFELLTDELLDDIDTLSERYERVQNRYDTVTDRLNRQLDLEISQRNKSLAEASVDLQEETRDLTESSVDFQKQVSDLTTWIFILTIVVALQPIWWIWTGFVDLLPQQVEQLVMFNVNFVLGWIEKNPVLGSVLSLLALTLIIGGLIQIYQEYGPIEPPWRTDQ